MPVSLKTWAVSSLGTACTPLQRTWQVNGIGVAKLLRGLEELIVGHRREKRDHVVESVVTNGGQLLRPGVARGVKPFHPLVEDGISKGVKNLQSQSWASTFIKLFQNLAAFKTLSPNVAAAFERKRRQRSNLGGFYRTRNQETSWESSKLLYIGHLAVYILTAAFS